MTDEVNQTPAPETTNGSATKKQPVAPPAADPESLEIVMEPDAPPPTDATPKEEELKEPYCTLNELIIMHPESKINAFDIETKTGGLSSEEAKKRIGIYGYNRLTPPPRTPEWLLLLRQFNNLFLQLLLICAVLALISYILYGDKNNLYLGVILAVVVFLTGLLGYHEEGKALKVLDSFSKILPSKCKVIRDGDTAEINAEDLVPGDIIVMEGGGKVPADCVIIKCRNLKTDCSMITGEAELVTCTDLPSKPGLGMFECTNMAFNGSLCFDGIALGLVLKTGDNTAIGTFAKLVGETATRESTLQVEVKNFVKLVGIIAFIMASAAFAISCWRNHASTPDEVVTIFINGFLVILVANIPQGLPSTVVSLLSLAARKMAQKNVLVKRIDCVETLGSCSIICSDKTGTLTKNEMTVTDIWYNKRLSRMFSKECDSLQTEDPQALLYRCAILCNRGESTTKLDVEQYIEAVHGKVLRQMSHISRLSWGNSIQNASKFVEEFEKSKPAVLFKGNPSDIALLNYFNRSNAVAVLRHLYPVVFEVPFNSTNKWQLVIVKKTLQPAPGQTTVDFQVFMKGAPEMILARCTNYTYKQDKITEPTLVPITEEFKTEFFNQYEAFAANGRRVLAFCSTAFPADANSEFVINDDGTYNFPTKDLTFIGMTAIMDPPRDNVPDAIKSCHSAGVKVFMVTGDHPLTGKSISRQINLLTSDNNIELLEHNVTKPSLNLVDWEQCDGAVIHGIRVDGITDEQWKILLTRKGGLCFARTTPVHKRYIVEKCQTLSEGGAIVAVTGDGVNDAPALKQGDIGIAMGLNGSAVAQDAADILLMDDNFASIVSGIEVGRIIFDNIKKTIAYVMAHIFPEVVSALIALLIGIPQGLTALQVLSIDLGTEMLVGISLANEGAESDIMQRKPRDLKKDRLVSPTLLFYAYVSSGCIISAGCMLAYTYTYWQHDVYLADFFNVPGLTSQDYFNLSPKGPITIRGRTYSEEEQSNIFSQGVTAFYIALTCGQFGHIWSCKTRSNSFFKHDHLSNTLTFWGVFVGICIVVFFSYIPGVQGFMGSATVGYFPWVIAIVNGVTLLIYNEIVKYFIRKQKPNEPLSCVSKYLAW